MKKIALFLILVLALGLPFHGALTVFPPECFRYWKELVLGLLLGMSIGKMVWTWWKKRESFPILVNAEWLAFLFLLWGAVLVISSDDWQTALFAFRYLGFGFLVYLIFSRLFVFYGGVWKQEVFQKFSSYFVGSCLASVLFGVWAKFLGGFEVLRSFYSTTISSWVPGQALPLYHEANGVVRLQGGGSGPIEFSHLLLLAVFLSFYFKFGRSFWGRGFILLILLFGIYQSYSRAALLALVVGGGIWIFFQAFFKKWRKVCLVGSLFLVLGGGMFFGLSQDFQKKFLERGGTSEHFTRPLEAIQVGLDRPFLGHLGQLGPAARALHLREKNDDQALIAENVFVDYFAQLGIVGVFLAFAFFVSVFWRVQESWFPLIGGFLVVAHLATIFDMTPLSIAFFLVLSFIQKLSQKLFSR